MFVRNYYMFKYYMEYVYQNTSTGTNVNNALNNITNYDGTTSGIDDRTINIGTTSSSYQAECFDNRRLWCRPNVNFTDIASNTIGYSARVGLSDTEVTLDDYDLGERDDTISCSIQSNAIGTVDSDFNFVRTITILLTNTSDTDKTVKEVGLYKRCNGDSYIRYAAKVFLFLREVLDTPVNIPAGKNATIVIEIKETLKP